MKWPDDIVWFLILLIPLLIMGYLMLRASDKQKARDEEMAVMHPNFREWKKLDDRWMAFVMIPFLLILYAEDVASWCPALKPILESVIPLLFFAWAPAMICAMVLWGSRYRDWKSYLIGIWRPMLITMVVALVYGRACEITEGLAPAVKWAQVGVGAALSPVMLRMSGFFELDELRLEPAPKSVILGPTGKEL